jgi:nitrilase
MEGIIMAQTENSRNFDPSDHYSRPDVTQLTVNRQRQTSLVIKA